MLRHRSVQRFVIGRRDGQHTSLQILPVVTAIRAFPSARVHQLDQLRLDARRHHPQACPASLSSRALRSAISPPPTISTVRPFEVVEQREVFHGRILGGRLRYGHHSHYGRDAPCRRSRIRPDAGPR